MPFIDSIGRSRIIQVGIVIKAPRLLRGIRSRSAEQNNHGQKDPEQVLHRATVLWNKVIHRADPPRVKYARPSSPQLPRQVGRLEG